MEATTILTRGGFVIASAVTLLRASFGTTATLDRYDRPTTAMLPSERPNCAPVTMASDGACWTTGAFESDPLPPQPNSKTELKINPTEMSCLPRVLI